MKATALTVICFAFLVALYGCGPSPTLQYLNTLKDRVDKQDDQIERLEDKLNAKSDSREDQAQAKIDSIIKELEGKSVDEMSEREYNLLLAQIENENETLRANAKADEAITERHRAKTYRMVGWSNMVGTSFGVLAFLWYIIRSI